MKKFMFFMLLSLFTMKSQAQSSNPQFFPGVPIVFSVATTNGGGGIYNPSEGHLPVGRTPIAQPNVSIDGYTLYFNKVVYNFRLQLVDEDGEVVYTTFVPQGTPSVTLPGSLSGDYELRLLWGNWCFYGWINL